MPKSFQLVVVNGPHQGQKFEFGKDRVTLGRDDQCDVKLINDHKVSRVHAEIIWVGDDLVIQNLTSRNYIVLNGKEVHSEVLPEGALVLVGDSEIKIVHNSENLIQAQKVKSPLQPQVKTKPPLPAVPPPMARAQSQFTSPEEGQHSPGKLEPAKKRNPKFYLIVGVIVLLVLWLVTGKKKEKPEDPNKLKTNQIVEIEMKSFEKLKEELNERKQKIGTDNFRMVQENFIKGFRDYNQGQFSRAREAFQVVLNLDPENQLAKDYLEKSGRRFNELVEKNMLQGNKYREIKNWRLCRNSYYIVLVMISNNQNNPNFKEAKASYEACDSALQGRF